MSNKKTIELLKQLLADSYALYLKTQNYHWNVTGPNFKSLHELFEDQYKELAEQIDTIAERIRALGDLAPGDFKTYSETTKIKSPKSDSKSPDMLKDLIESHEQILKVLNNCFAAADEVKDEGTIDLISTLIESHEKNTWMLKSSL